MAKFDVLMLVGVGHSGSTLLGSLLSAHPAIGCVGEFARLGESLEQSRPCSCGAAILDCPFWSPIIPQLGMKRKFDPYRLRLEHYDLLRRAQGKEVVLDTSKEILVRMVGRLFSPLKSPRVGFLFLVRDSRGVLGAALRHGRELAPQLAKHEKWIRRVERFVKARSDSTLTLHYENLCREPEGELRRICAWLDVPFRDEMLLPSSAAHHLVHANSMSYLGRSSSVRLDERWRTEIPAEQLAEIERVMRRIPLLRDRYLAP